MASFAHPTLAEALNNLFTAMDAGQGRNTWVSLKERLHSHQESKGLKPAPGFRCDFRDPFGNRIQVVDLHDESLVWLLPYQEVQKVGIKFSETGSS